MNKVASTLIALVLAWAGATNAGSVIYDNRATVNTGFFSDPYALSFFADDFSLTPGRNVITDIHWTGGYAFANTPPTADNFSIGITSDAGGVPGGSTAFSLSGVNPGRTDTGLDINLGFSTVDLYAYWVNIEPMTLAQNTRFWLSIRNDTFGDRDDRWFWGGEMSASAGNAAAFPFSEVRPPWVPVPNARADFQLTGPPVIPLPPALPLLIGGLLTLFGLGWRRNQAV
jgi:hypothetical protein